MTFTEAAVEVLRLVGKPLHYKKITEVAIERNLLSHVGKTPEVTMSSRLATMVKRDRGEAPIIKVKPGVFGLREFTEEQLADLSGDVDELPEVDVSENEQAKPEEGTPEPTAEGEVKAAPAPVAPRKPLPGADVFPEEEDDDEPILGGDEEEEDDDEEGEGEASGEGGGAASESRAARRRRKRRRRGGEEAAEEARPAAEARSERTEREPRNERSGRREGREERSGRREGREDARRNRDERREGRDRDSRDSRERQERDERRQRDDREERRPQRDELSLDMNREPADGDLLGKELADAVASVLSQSGPRGLPAIRVADMLVRKGRLAGDPNALLPTVMAAVRADAARRRHEPRPRFRIEGQSIVLSEFLLPQDVVRAEQEVLRAAERQRERARRAFLRKLSELPGAGLAEIVATWLNAEGVVGLRAVRRPNAGAGELHLAGTLRRGPEEVRLAVVIYRDGRELGREKVIEARGALHYYGSATTAWLVTLGAVMSGAREEATAPATAPVALFDGLALATAMERVSVGLGVQQVAISCLDFDLLDSLRGWVPREREPEGRGRERERDDRERGRGRDRERDRDRDDRGREERGGRDRPRLVLERPPVAEEHDDAEELEELREHGDEPPLEAGDEEAAPAAQGDEEQGGDAQAQGEAREGGRRRRRRRRRKGGRGGDGQQANGTNEPNEAAGDEADEDDEERANGDEGEPEAEPREDERDPRDDDEERGPRDYGDHQQHEDEREPSEEDEPHDDDHADQDEHPEEDDERADRDESSDDDDSDH